MDDTTPGEVERRELHGDGVARGDAHVTHADRTRDVGHDAVAVVEVHAVERVRHRLGDAPPDRNHVSRYVPSSPQSALKI